MQSGGVAAQAPSCLSPLAVLFHILLPWLSQAGTLDYSLALSSHASVEPDGFSAEPKATTSRLIRPIFVPFMPPAWPRRNAQSPFSGRALITGFQGSDAPDVSTRCVVFLGTTFPHDDVALLRVKLACGRGGEPERKEVFTTENSRMADVSVECWC